MNLQEITFKLNEEFNPVSILLYGSRARTDYLKNSDYEIGLFYSKNNYVDWTEIKKLIKQKGVNIYSFCFEDFLEGNLDTPFQKTIYKRELITSGETLSGFNIQELNPPEIKILDLIEDIRFNSGYALASLHPYRNGDKKSSSLLFYKSCLFATRNLIMLETGKFPRTYNEIVKYSGRLKLVNNSIDYERLVEKAFNTRLKRTSIKVEDIIQNISYINNFIEPRLKGKYKENKELIVVK